MLLKDMVKLFGATLVGALLHYLYSEYKNDSPPSSKPDEKQKTPTKDDKPNALKAPLVNSLTEVPAAAGTTMSPLSLAATPAAANSTPSTSKSNFHEIAEIFSAILTNFNPENPHDYSASFSQDVQRQNSELHEQISKKVNELNLNDQEKELLRREIKQIEKKLEEEKTVRINTQKRIAKLGEKIDLLQEQFQEKENALTEEIANRKQEQSEISGLQSKLSQLEKQNDKLTSAYDTSLIDNVKLDEKIKELTALLEKSNETNKELQEKLNSLQSTQTQLQADHNTSKLVKEKLEATISELDGKLKEAEDLLRVAKESSKQDKNKITKIEDEVSEYQSTKVMHQQTIDRFKQKINDLQQKLDQLENENKTLKGELQTANEKNQELEREAASLKALHADSMDVRSRQKAEEEPVFNINTPNAKEKSPTIVEPHLLSIVEDTGGKIEKIVKEIKSVREQLHTNASNISGIINQPKDGGPKPIFSMPSLFKRKDATHVLCAENMSYYFVLECYQKNTKLFETKVELEKKLFTQIISNNLLKVNEAGKIKTNNLIGRAMLEFKNRRYSIALEILANIVALLELTCELKQEPEFKEMHDIANHLFLLTLSRIIYNDKNYNTKTLIHTPLNQENKCLNAKAILRQFFSQDNMKFKQFLEEYMEPDFLASQGVMQVILDLLVEFSMQTDTISNKTIINISMFAHFSFEEINNSRKKEQIKHHQDLLDKKLELCVPKSGMNNSTSVTSTNIPVPPANIPVLPTLSSAHVKTTSLSTKPESKVQFSPSDILSVQLKKAGTSTSLKESKSGGLFSSEDLLSVQLKKTVTRTSSIKSKPSGIYGAIFEAMELRRANLLEDEFEVTDSDADGWSDDEDIKPSKTKVALFSQNLPPLPPRPSAPALPPRDVDSSPVKKVAKK